MEAPPVEQPFQQLHLTCPDGLKVSYALESSLGKWSVYDLKCWFRLSESVKMFVVFQTMNLHSALVSHEKVRPSM